MRKIHYRNIISLGGYTKVVSIPRILLKNRKLQKGNEVVIEITGNDKFTVTLPK